VPLGTALAKGIGCVSLLARLLLACDFPSNVAWLGATHYSSFFTCKSQQPSCHSGERRAEGSFGNEQADARIGRENSNTTGSALQKVKSTF